MNTESEKNVGGRKKNQVFTEILQDIRDMKVLSNYQLYYLRGTSQISRSNLLEIIELYNFVIHNVNGVLRSIPDSKMDEYEYF
jgi:hypothetical protein